MSLSLTEPSWVNGLKKPAHLISSFSLAVALSWSAEVLAHEAPGLGDMAPEFTASSTAGEIEFLKAIEGKYALIFSHPKDFTPVCLTELAEVEQLLEEFHKRNTLVFGLSVDSVANHNEWVKDILALAKKEGDKLGYPLFGDENLEIAKLFGMLAENEQSTTERSAKDNKTARTVFLIGKDKRIRMTMTYPMTTGRNFREIIRVLDSIILTDSQEVATPVNWEPGEKVVAFPGLSRDEIVQKHRITMDDIEVVPLPSSSSGKEYLRYIPYPVMNQQDDADKTEL